MIFIGGYHASGKSFLAGILEDEFAFLHIETSAVVRNMWESAGTDENLQDWAARMEGVYGSDYFDIAIARNIKIRHESAVHSGREIQDVVVTGNRSLEGVQYLAEYFEGTPIGEKPKTIIAVKTHFDNLFLRFRDRNRREGDATISMEDFRTLTLSETRRGLEDILAVADHTLYNDYGRDEFVNTSVKFFEEILGMRRVKDHVLEYAQHTLDGPSETDPEINYRKNV